MERNDTIFNDIKRPRMKLILKIWLGLIDYKRLNWDSAKRKNKEKFQEVWCRKSIFVEMIGGHPRWKLTRPDNGFDVH
jgi:hypothetical protein